ncbi:MAG: hypothetical protein RIE77_06285 [Phycisphaerales bacterium]|jgi:hypothetical protein
MPRKAATKKKARRGKAKDAGPLLPEGSTRKLVLACVGLVLATGVVLGAGLGIPALGRQAAQRINEQSDSIFIQLTPPEGMPPASYDAIMDRAEAAYRASAAELGAMAALRPEPLRAVQEAMASTGWAASTPIVTRRRPTRTDEQGEGPGRNDIVIEMDWRRPVAVVRSAAFQPGVRPGLRDTAIDASGDVLPLSGPPESLPGLKVILNPASMPGPADRGDANPTWPGQDIQDAIALLALLERERFAVQITGIDLAEHGEGQRLLVVTTTGGRVVWGAPPGGEGVYRGEVSEERKLANLRSLVDATGQLDGGQERVEIHWPGTVLIGDDAARGGAGGRP